MFPSCYITSFTYITATLNFMVGVKMFFFCHCLNYLLWKLLNILFIHSWRWMWCDWTSLAFKSIYVGAGSLAASAQFCQRCVELFMGLSMQDIYRKERKDSWQFKPISLEGLKCVILYTLYCLLYTFDRYISISVNSTQIKRGVRGLSSLIVWTQMTESSFNLEVLCRICFIGAPGFD